VTCHPRGENYGDKPHPAHVFPMAERLWRLSAPSPLGVTRSSQSRGLASSSSCRVPNCPAKRWHRAPPSPRGPQSRRWGGRLAGTCHPARVGTAGLLPVYTSVRRDFRPGLSSVLQRVRCSQAPMATAFVLGPQGYALTLVLCVWLEFVKWSVFKKFPK
jgi:hypothetical protein